MPISISYDVDYGSRNAVLRALALEVGIPAGALAQSAGETHPNWVQQLNRILTVLGMPTYSSLDMSAFQTVVGAIVTRINAVPPPPVNTTPPAVTPAGTAANGAVLTTTNGTWTNTPTSYVRQWERDGLPIGNQSATTYTTTISDQGHNVGCQIYAVNAGGDSAPVLSNAVAIT